MAVAAGVTHPSGKPIGCCARRGLRVEDSPHSSERLADAVQGRARRPTTPEACRLGLERAGRPMSDAAVLLEQGADNARVGESQREALRRLQLLLDALAAGPAPAATPPSEPSGQPPSSTARAPRVSLGELRLVRSLQLEINERTAELERQSRDANAGDDGPFVELAEDQSRLAEIIQSLVAASDGEQSQPETPVSPGPSDAELDKALEKAGIPGFSED